MDNMLKQFKLQNEEEDFKQIHAKVEDGIEFKGTNLWVLIFAIFIASLGLNVNSTAVIIGAMLVSPLMGPIIGLGLATGINDLRLLRRSWYNYIFAAGVGLATSTVYFLITPLNEAHSEILARTSPNIYDVLIAFFGGLAGMLATSSKLKGNVIPGVAIATALMPPLCTAGYGLATFQLQYFFGALYLFIINTVFIALATITIVRILHFPYIQFADEKTKKKNSRIMWLVTIITLLPSLYFGYDIVKRDAFNKNAEKFIAIEAIFPDDYLLKKDIDAKEQTITLTFGGKKIASEDTAALNKKLKNYNLQKATLIIKQGFAYLDNTDNTKQNTELDNFNKALQQKENEIQFYKKIIDSINQQNDFVIQLNKEARAINTHVKDITIAPLTLNTDTTIHDSISKDHYLFFVETTHKLDKNDKAQLEKWLGSKMSGDKKIVFE